MMSADLPLCESRDPSPARRLRARLAMATMIALFLVGLIGLAAATGWEETLAQIARLTLLQGGILLALSLVNYLLRGLRWHLFARRLGLTTALPQDMRHFLGGLAMIVTPGRVGELVRMREAFEALQSSSAAAEETLSLGAVFLPSIWRAVLWILVAGLAGGVLYRTARRAPCWRATLNGSGAAVCGLLCAWIVEAPWWFAPAVPLALFAIPAVLWQAWRRRWAASWRLALAWVLAVLPVAVLSRPLG
jgi:uncharacterized membrane protein YbhN (UPF0104 family)